MKDIFYVIEKMEIVWEYQSNFFLHNKLWVWHIFFKPEPLCTTSPRNVKLTILEKPTFFFWKVKAIRLRENIKW